MVNYGPLTAEIGSGVWGTPANFNGVSRLGSVTAPHSSSGRQPNFAALNRGSHLHSAGGPSRWALAHILVGSCISSKPRAAHFMVALCNRADHIYFHPVSSSSLWSPYGRGQTIIFSCCGLLFFLLFFSSPNLSRRRLDVCHTSTHGVALVRI